MNNTYTSARFWKCALQVNPYSYKETYRGTSHKITEGEYNQQLLEVAVKNDIKVIGLANHGNVEEVDAIRHLMNQHEIIVFPGFEITSTEKTHYVCLFGENTDKNTLNRYLGALGLTDAENGTWPSRLGGQEILSTVNKLGGFVFAAHATEENGILKQKLVHVWKDPLLKATQIPNSLDDLKNEKGNACRQILLNKNPDYKREIPIGIINAGDVAKPADLANPRASCLIKMTAPSFASFKLAFQDTESRVRLHSDVSERHYSCLKRLKITGGYLDGVSINFSDHLNTVIGGRGTGKSTLLECLRFVLDAKPIGTSAQRQHQGIIKENLGKSMARVELEIRSSTMNGKCFTVARRYGESSSIKDENGEPSSFTSADLLPEIEIYGQNEIFEIAQDKASQRQLLFKLLEAGGQGSESRIQTARNKLKDNRKKLIETQNSIAEIEYEIAQLPKLQEQVKQFKSMGLEDKLKIVPRLETEKRLLKRALEEEGPNLDAAFRAVRDSLPDTVFLSERALENLPHADKLKKIRGILNKLRGEAEELLTQWHGKYEEAKTQAEQLAQEVNTGIQQEEELLEKDIKSLPSSEGKTGEQVGLEFQQLVKEIERIRPRESALETTRQLAGELKKTRKSILDELSEIRATRSAELARSIKKLDNKLEKKLRLKVEPESDRTPIIQFLLQCELDNVGSKRLSWLNEADPFSPVKLAELIRQGADALSHADWRIPSSVSETLPRLSPEKILELEEIELSDSISIELNTAHEGQENYRPLDKLSTGQQCTAILHLLPLQNRDPLIMDQPEDNLDNAFIADRIVAELRSAKIARQFIFATHNANIPVFGDAEWIGVFEASEGQAHMPSEFQGAIDVGKVRDMAANILEGGKMAFNQRKAKYGF